MVSTLPTFQMRTCDEAGEATMTFIAPLAFIVSAIFGASSGGYTQKTPRHDIKSSKTVVLDTSTLSKLEGSGLAFEDHMLEDKSPYRSDVLLTNDQLYFNSAAYRSLVDLTYFDEAPNLPTGDIHEIRTTLSGFNDDGAWASEQTRKPYRISEATFDAARPYLLEREGDEPRIFDPRWLKSPFARHQLIALVNRMDKRDFGHGRCGEIRLIYRLSYRTKTTQSTLPHFINVVRRWSDSKPCVEHGRSWMRLVENLETQSKSQQQRHDNLVRLLLESSDLHQIELNYQSVRFTSGYMTDLGGQAMYIQRVLRKKKSRFEPMPLENTPNVEALLESKHLLDILLNELKDPKNLHAIDQGTWVFPDKLEKANEVLATRSISWSTMGHARKINKPYARIFDGREGLLADIDYHQLDFIKNERGLIERLDNMTCMGCHQSGGTAGFHILGRANQNTSHSFNRQQFPVSPHLRDELMFRELYLDNVINNQENDSFRSLSAFRHDASLERGSLCLNHLGQNTFRESASCAHSTTCHTTVKGRDSIYGECVVTESGDHRDLYAGGACFEGTLIEYNRKQEHSSSSLVAFQDRFKVERKVHDNYGRGDRRKRYSCASPKSGAPLGRRGRQCSKAEETFKVFDELHPDNVSAEPERRPDYPNEICAHQGGRGFDACAAGSNAGACLEKLVARAMLDTCNADRLCREDYICQQIPRYDLSAREPYERTKKGIRVNKASPGDIDSKIIEDLHRDDVGFCVPTYFLFNMRVDGHPDPMSGLSQKLRYPKKLAPLRGQL